MSMKKTYLAKLSFRNILAHKLRSVLTIMGVAIGVGFIVFLISLGYGLQRISTQQIANLEALQVIDVTPGKSKIVKINDGVIDKFKSLSDVIDVEPEASVVGKVAYGTSVTESVIYGKNVEYLKLEDARLLKGQIYKDNALDQAVVNQTTIKQLGIGSPESAIGKKINLKLIISGDFLDNDKGLAKEATYEIVGVLENESSPYVYIPLDRYKAYGVKNYTSAKVKVGSKASVDGTKRQLENLGFKTTTLKDTVDQINQFFVIFQLILLSFGIIAIIIAALGMFNTLTISLLEKTREISFMKVLGTEKKDIWQLFLAEAVIIGIIGTAMGVFGGLLAGSGLNNFLIDLAQRTGNKPVDIFYTPVSFVLIVFITSIVISVLTGIYPSVRATKIDPLEAMRYE
jgi:putative ABC transport system permease protein